MHRWLIGSTVFVVVVVVVVCFFCFGWYYRHYRHRQLKLAPQTFFNVNDIFPQLNSIEPLRNEIDKEINMLLSDEKKHLWHDWPEKNLYDEEKINNNSFLKPNTWKIFPFYAFGVWVNDNCAMVPNLTQFIKGLGPTMKLATLSRLSPGMKLKTHRGWGNHSNHVLRCHYGVRIPTTPENSCYVGVENERQYHENGKWLVFDDSLNHMAENMSTTEEDRLVLIVDLQRPENIPLGTSVQGDTKELLDLVDYFKKKQIY